jgi:ankyrin repeat protein
MKSKMHTEVQDPIAAFVASACVGDTDAMRAQVAEGFDLNARDRLGDTILEQVISELEFFPATPKYAVIREMLHLGADPRGLGEDGSSPLFTAVLNMDTEMMRILLDAGADPNEVLRILLGPGTDPDVPGMDSMDESLYDWAEFAYRYEVWSNKLPDGANAAFGTNREAWLRYLDHLAVTYGKRRPDHLRLLRQRGALSMSELRHRSTVTGRPRSPTHRPSSVVNWG